MTVMYVHVHVYSVSKDKTTTQLPPVGVNIQGDDSPTELLKTAQLYVFESCQREPISSHKITVCPVVQQVWDACVCNVHEIRCGQLDQTADS